MPPGPRRRGCRRIWGSSLDKEAQWLVVGGRGPGSRTRRERCGAGARRACHCESRSGCEAPRRGLARVGRRDHQAASGRRAGGSPGAQRGAACSWRVRPSSHGGCTREQAMSRRAKLTFGASVLFASASIGYVHFAQEWDRESMSRLARQDEAAEKAATAVASPTPPTTTDCEVCNLKPGDVPPATSRA